MCRLASHQQIYDPVLGSRTVPAWKDLWIHKTVKGRRGLFEGGGGGEREKDGCEWRRKVGGAFLAAC